MCVQSESSLLKDRRSSSAGLKAASSDTVLLRDVASLTEVTRRVILNISILCYISFSFIFLNHKTLFILRTTFTLKNKKDAHAVSL